MVVDLSEKLGENTRQEVTFCEGKLLATIYFGEDEEDVTIDDWHSLEKGKGNTNLALEKLRQRFKIIVVAGIGKNKRQSRWKYWMHQRETKRVDYLYDDNGTLV